MIVLSLAVLCPHKYFKNFGEKTSAVSVAEELSYEAGEICVETEKVTSWPWTTTGRQKSFCSAVTAVDQIVKDISACGEMKLNNFYFGRLQIAKTAAEPVSQRAVLRSSFRVYLLFLFRVQRLP